MSLSRCAWPTRPWWTRPSASCPSKSASTTPPSSPSLAALVRDSHFKSVSTSQNCSLVPLVKVGHLSAMRGQQKPTNLSFVCSLFWSPVLVYNLSLTFFLFFAQHSKCLPFYLFKIKEWATNIQQTIEHCKCQIGIISNCHDRISNMNYAQHTGPPRMPSPLTLALPSLPF